MQGNSVAVLGAGMVGVSAALHLQRRGFAVTLIDRRDPGEETSYGNAGAIEGGSYTPIAFPRKIKDIIAFALNQRAEARYHPMFLPKVAGWLYQLYQESARDKLFENSDKFRQALSNAIGAHKALAHDANADNLIRDCGWLALYPDDNSMRDNRMDRDIAIKQGVGFEELSVGEVLDLEPHLKPDFVGGVYWPAVSHTSDPEALTKAYAALFADEGGKFLRANITGLAQADRGWRVTHADGQIEAQQIVVALGPWSLDLLSPLGVQFPLAAKRGYHCHYRPQGNAVLSRPVIDLKAGFVMAPMAKGIRVTTGIEFADRDAPKTPEQLAAVLPRVKELFPIGDPVEDEPWMGARPAFPDSRAAIGAVETHDGLWVDFGHAHLGLTLGPISGHLLADLMTGKKPVIDPEPFSPARFG